MSFPPVKNPGAVKLPKDKIVRTQLNMTESFALINWLKARKMQQSDTPQSLALESAIALGNLRITVHHIKQRCEEFGIKLPSRVSNSSTIERLDRLERVLTAVIREQAKLLNGLGVEPAAEVLAFLDE